MGVERPALRGKVLPYRPPAPLQDVHVLDVLELAGSQGRAAVALNLHQSTVSRSSRLLQRQLRLRLRPGGLVCRYGQNACLQHLRLAYREHRLMEGVLRLSTDGLHQGLLGRLGGLQAVPPRFRSSEQWAELVRCGLLDGALLSSLGQESPPPRVVERPPAWPGLTALPLGELRLQLLGPCPSIQAVLLPPQRLAPRLHQLLAGHGLAVQEQPLACQEPAAWLKHSRDRQLALPLCPGLLPPGWCVTQGLVPLAKQPPLREQLWLLLPQETADSRVAGRCLWRLRALIRRAQSMQILHETQC